MRRHRWDPSVGGYVRCSRCGLEVRESAMRRGGLGPCEPGRWKFASEAGESEVDGLAICKSCEKLVPDAIVCIYCGEQLHHLGWTPRRGE